MNYILKNDIYEATISTKGAELVSLKMADGFEYIWQGREDLWSDHAPLLFPICGRVPNAKYTLGGKWYDMGLHGFLSVSEFSLSEYSDTKIVLTFESNEETRVNYPFDFLVTATYTLDGDKIHFDAKVKNMGSELMPYMFGWHPAFNLKCDDGQDINDYKFYFGEDVTSLEWYPIDRQMHMYPIPDSHYHANEAEIYENDTMIFKGHNNFVKMYAEGHPYEVYMEWSENIPTLCIWKEPYNEHKFICIEPWAYTPKNGIDDNDFNVRKMQRIESGVEEEFNYTVKITI